VAGALGALPATHSGNAMRLMSGSTQLFIPEPDPEWWETSSIWVVPGTDPNGKKGVPVAGQPAYVWAEIHNVSNVKVNDVQVRFYWANPAFEMLFSTINLIGTAHASIQPGSSQKVLCLVPWQVEFANKGHECLVVAASLPGDPPLPDLVDAPGYPQVAQKNVTVWKVPPEEWDWSHIILIATGDESRTIHVDSRIGGELPPETLEQLGLREVSPVDGSVVDVRFSLRPGGGGEPRITVEVPAGATVPLYSNIRRTQPLPANRYQHVIVSATHDGQLIGGVSFVVMAQD